MKLYVNAEHMTYGWIIRVTTCQPRPCRIRMGRIENLAEIGKFTTVAWNRPVDYRDE